MIEIPRPYEIYRHFKGKCYQVLSIATHSETGEQMVVYQQLYAPYGVYVRPLEMFISKVDKEKYPDVEQEYRFEKIQDVSWENPAGAQTGRKVQENVNSSAGQQTQENTKPSSGWQVQENVNPPAGQPVPETADPQTPDSGEFQLDAGLLAFLEADSYEKKLEILSSLHATITDSMIDTMAVSLDIEVKDGDIEQRYSEILNCLLTMERFECNRLR